MFYYKSVIASVLTKLTGLVQLHAVYRCNLSYQLNRQTFEFPYIPISHGLALQGSLVTIGNFHSPQVVSAQLATQGQSS